MNTNRIRPGMQLESDTVYTADQEQYEIYLKDTQKCMEKRHLAIAKRNSGCLNTLFYAKGLKNVVLDFNGAVLHMHGSLQPFLLEECDNVIIKNVVIEYDRSCHSEFEILEKADGVLKLKPREKFPCRVENGCLIPYFEDREWRNLSTDCHFIMIFDSNTGEGVDNPLIMIGEDTQDPENAPGKIFHLKASEEGDAIILTGELPGSWEPGMTAVISHACREICSCLIICSKNITIENYRMVNGIGMGILGMYSENLTIRGLKLFQDQQSHGLVSNDGDAMHMVACFGKMEICDCICEGMEDDALNVHGNYYHVNDVDKNFLYARWSDPSTGMNAHFKMFGDGDRIAVYEGNSMVERGRFTIRKVTLLDDYKVVFELDRETEGICHNDTIENLSAQPELTIRNCRFGKANSNLRLQTRKPSLIENCRFSIPILLTGDKNYWHESGPVNDLTIQNCIFTGKRGKIMSIPEGLDYQAEAPYYHSGVKIRNNSFEASDALTAIRTNDITFQDNICTNETGTFQLKLKDCGKVKLLE